MPKINSEISTVILESLRDYLIEKNLHIPATFGLESIFLQGDLQMDSLDLAIFLLLLEEKIGQDPFRGGFRSFVTVADLVKIYEEH
jgi:acyl carrier protein